ncbi:hypothetical protein Cni_G20144 [Canna indica]|uniref:NTF2 domain-containing protein n=1 Tax=Canna indica TaxID=4628 RepID=A0AAQ3KLY7_9LILI|nr:hypothetical protein Cni_G20144 [Canna indica]
MAAWPMSAADSLHYAQVVGDTFVDQYYRYLKNSPELVHRFYHENSRLGRADEDGNLTSITTIDFKGATSRFSFHCNTTHASPIIISRCNVYVKEKRILSSGVNNRERPAQNKTRGFWNGGTRENGDQGGWRSTAREGTESKHDSGSRVTSWKYSSNGGNVESL